MASFSTTLYETVCFLGKPSPAADRPIYHEYVFPSVSLYTGLLAVGLVVVFYFVLNHSIASLRGFDKKWHWFVMLLLMAGASAGIAFYVAQQQGAQTHPYRQYFALANAVLGAVVFTLLSLLGKNGSKDAKHLPV